MSVDLSRVKDREDLSGRREPYWHRLRPGCFLGYRPSLKGGAGTWIARAYDEEQRCYRMKALGSFGDEASKDRYAKGKKEAEKFAAKVESGSLSDEKLETVGDACRRFATSHGEAEARFERYVFRDPIAKVKLDRLRKSHVEAWRDRLAATPALVSRSKKVDPVTRPRSPATLNRDMAVFRTALGKAIPLGTPNTEAAWQEPLKPLKNAVKRRTLRLDRDQRRILLNGLDDDAHPFVAALCLLPLRPGALAGLTVADFDKRSRELTIGKDKSGNDRRILLPTSAAALFTGHTKDKLPAAPLFQRANGKPWDKDAWKLPIAAAVVAGQLPRGTTAYTLRHSIISELVEAGLPLLTVAQIAGTSAAMIEKHYGHLDAKAATEALAGLAL